MSKITRRSFMAIAAAGLAQRVQAKNSRKQRASTSKPRRLLFNWDGSMIHCFGRTVLPDSKGPLTREQFASLVFAPLENTAVDILMFSFGSGNVAEYQSSVLEWPGQADNFKFPESKKWHGGIEVDPKDQYLNPKSLADSGHNPPAVIVEECRKRGLGAFVSFRMNDCHDGQHPKETLPNPELPTFKRQNPDWLVEDLDWWSALDYERPTVRALKLKAIEEFFERWDFDGIELDWLRHTLNFRRGTDRENGKHLTQFMRAVRKSLNDKASQRGRPIEIAVRIPERLEWCLEGGFEIPAWISEDLVDFLILGQGLTELPSLREFRTLMKAKPLPIYPSLYSYGNGYRLSPDDVIRGSAANLWRDGADGLYAFNWFVYGTWRKALLNEIAQPELLRKASKHYTLVHRFEATPRAPGADYIRYNTMLKDAPVPFHLNVADGAKTVFVPIADDVASKKDRPKRAELWIAMDYSQPGDVLSVSLGDKVLEPGDVDAASRWETAGGQLDLPPGNGMLGFAPNETVDLSFKALRWNVPVQPLIPGRNKFSIALKKRGAGSDKPLRVTRVELVTRMQDAGVNVSQLRKA
ncbi:MAG: hypothetical protein FJW26_12170 [Acidimicrobiia bacterium]|nr:hypothetical protein [Acidimicrobiia bacterium]